MSHWGERRWSRCEVTSNYWGFKGLFTHATKRMVQGRMAHPPGSFLARSGTTKARKTEEAVTIRKIEIRSDFMSGPKIRRPQQRKI